MIDDRTPAQALPLVGAVPVVVTATEAQGFKITPAQLEAAITPKTKALMLNNPSNPTGMYYNEAELRAIEAVDFDDMIERAEAREARL